jgi:peptidyl-tRNA hydrolase, PTH2 family
VTADPWVQYLVVRKDHPITRAEAMALAGAGSVLCADRFRTDEHHEAAYRAWSARPRKVALRAGEAELAHLHAELDCVALESVFGLTLLALPPRLRSASEPELVALRPYTDPPRRAREEPGDTDEDDGGVPLRYLIRPGVLRTAGKAMAQAGHAALMCADRLGPRYPEAFAAWRAAGAPGEVRVADLPHWAALRESPVSVVVADAGLTQVEPGTETVIGVAPVPDPPAALLDLPRL